VPYRVRSNAKLQMTDRIEAWRRRCAIRLGCFYALAGALHVMWPTPFLKITPNWVPEPQLVILLTGFCEIAGAVGILTTSYQRTAGVGLALYAACVYPANIKHAIDTLSGDPSIWQWAYHVVRLPLQPVLIWIALFAGGLATWPLRRQSSRIE
jgi:uncharacterized membrane protein